MRTWLRKLCDHCHTSYLRRKTIYRSVNPHVLKVGGVPGEALMEGTRLGDEFSEDAARHFVFLEGSLGVPLHAEDPVPGGGSLDGFDDVVLGRAGDDAQGIAGGGYCLVMAGVDGDVLAFGERGEAGTGLDVGGVFDDEGARHAVGPGMLHGRLDVLDEGSVAPDVERLGSVADGEDGLAHVVRILQEKLVEVVARRIGRGGFGMRRLAVLLRIDVGGRAGEENPIAGFGQLGGFDVGEIEREDDGLASGTEDGVHILGESAGGVLRVGVGNGDGDARLHGVDDNAGGPWCAKACKRDPALRWSSMAVRARSAGAWRKKFGTVL